jgi:glycosyltransferase involved in cell wall biosynthesis
MNFLSQHDVVFFEWASELLAYATHLPKTTAIVTRLHRYELYQWANQIDWTNVDQIILVSEAKRKEFNSRFPGFDEKIRVIPEAVNPQKFPYETRDFNKNLGILGHLTPRKRVYELILSFAELELDKRGYKLHVGGGAHPRFLDYYDAVISLPSRLKIDDNVIFYGNVQNPSEFYKKIDIFISNSYSEGLQVSPMEAISSGAYCFDHFWPGAQELLPHENLYSKDSELGEKIFEFERLPGSEKLQMQKNLRNGVLTKCNITLVSELVRKSIEEVASK